MLAGSGAPPPEENPPERKYSFLPSYSKLHRQSMSPSIYGFWPVNSHHSLKMNLMDTKPDFIEVQRTAHELGSRYGQNACQYAARLAAEALAEGRAEEAVFWTAVENCLKPRVTSG
jgi:hypothetical protein